MSGTIMWIVLGVLIGAVVIFLVITSILDRKKKKKIREEKKVLSVKVRSSGLNISKEVSKVIDKNDKLLKVFIPSVGKIKMSDINTQAKEALVRIRRTQDFKLLKYNEKEQKEFETHIDNLIREKSNNWPKRNIEDIKFFKNYKPIEPKKEEVETKVKKKNKKKKKDKETKK